MKRSRALLGILVLLVAAGCGGGGKKSSANTTTATTGASSMKVGPVTDIGGLNDRASTTSRTRALRAQRELGVRPACLPGEVDAGLRPEPVDVRASGL